MKTLPRTASRAHRTPGCESRNGGYGSEQELRVFERYALPLKPRLMAWFFFEGNDLDDDQNFDNAMLATPGATTPSVQNRGPAAGAPSSIDR